jgi:hypothetical protein
MHNLWPGGDIAFVRDRLARYDCERRSLTKWETRTEADGHEERAQVGVLYYDIVAKPIDLSAIKAKIDGKRYFSVKEFEADMKQLFNNARLFDETVSRRRRRRRFPSVRCRLTRCFGGSV